MKKITKIISMLLAMMLVLVSFASCGLVEDTKNVEKARITRETVLKIADGVEVSGAYYGYYFMSVYNEKLQEISASMSENSAATEEAPEIDKEEIKKEAIKRVIASKMAYTKAKEEGIVLSKEDNANISAIMEQMTTGVAQNGMSFSDFCKVMETSPEGIEQVITEEYMGNLYYAKLVSDEFVSAKHILVEAASEEEKGEALKKIKDIQAKINAGEDFDKLMNEFSTDPGLQSQPNGYTFTKGQMVEPFEKAAFALEVGGVSDIVETDYGYHIIKKIETSISGVASALTETATPEMSEKIEAEKEKLTKDVKFEETNKFSYYDSIIK
jgi:parvulin-like peptidyl-prolyl isomerase